MTVVPLFGDPIRPEDAQFPFWDSISVDASCSGNPGYLQFRGVMTTTGEELFKYSSPDGTNNVGEFLAVVSGLVYAKEKGLNVPIYTDSTTAISWVREKRIKTNLRRTYKNENLFKMIERAENILKTNDLKNPVIKWKTKEWGEIPADYGRK